MVQRSYPWDGGSVGQDQWALMSSAFATNGVIFVGTNTQLGRVSPGTGRQVSVTPHRAFINGVYVESTVAELFNISAVGAGSRTDAVGWTVDKSAKTAALTVFEGVTSVPANTSTLFYLELGLVTVTSTTTSFTTADIADKRKWAVAHGSVVRCPSTLVTAIYPDPHPGFMVWYTDLNQLMVYTGSSYIRVVDVPLLNSERPYCVARVSGGTFTVNTSTITPVLWSASAGDDPLSLVNTPTTGYFLPPSGLWEVNVRASFQSTASGGNRFLYIEKNDTDAGTDAKTAQNGVPTHMYMNRKIRFNGTTDKLRVLVQQTSGVDLTINGSSVSTYCELVRVAA